MTCNSDTASDRLTGVPLNQTVSLSNIGRLDLVPDVLPADYLAKGQCESFHGKTYTTSFPPVWDQTQPVDWSTITPAQLSFDDVSPRKDKTTHLSSDQVFVCGIGDGYGQIAAVSNNLPSSPPTFDIDVGTPPVSRVLVDGPSTVQDNAAPVQLTAYAIDPLGTYRVRTSRATWRSSDATIASVTSPGGLLTPHKKGTVTITGTVYGVSNTLPIEVLGVQSVSVTPSPATVRLAGTITLTAIPKDKNGTPFSGKAVTWTSSATSIATVSAGGVVSGVAKGQVSITATVDGVSGAATVTVLGVSTVAVSPATGNVRISGTLQLTATPKDANGVAFTGLPITWASSDASLATVSSSGVVTGVAKGSVTISATTDGVTGTAAVTVTERLLTVSVDGPLVINTATLQFYTWTATASGGETPYSYRWEINYALRPGWVVIGGNSSSVRVGVSPTGGNFLIRATVTSGSGQQTAQGSLSVKVTGGCGKLICD
jgi:uncharacterized protein YjdB